MIERKKEDGAQEKDNAVPVRESRRNFLKGLSIAAAACSASLVTGCLPSGQAGSGERFGLEWQEYFKKHYRLMTQNTWPGSETIWT